MESVTVALDWTPNTNHTGFYVAKSKGWYEEKGLDVQFISPHLDGYHTTPASRVHDRSATFALGPSESVISSHCSVLPQKSALKVILSKHISLVFCQLLLELFTQPMPAERQLAAQQARIINCGIKGPTTFILNSMA
jgi:NMT1/THI5 like